MRLSRLCLAIFVLFMGFAFGGECRISDIVWNGEHEMADEADLVNLIGEPCENWNGFVWKNASQKIQERYENRGFLAADLVGEILENPVIDSAGLERTAVLLVELNRGSAWVWGSAENMDSTGTKPDVFRKMTGLEIGAYVSPRDLERSNRRLSRMGYFEEIDSPRMYRDANRNRIIPVFNMRAATMSEAEALLTYSSESGLWEGNINVSLYNILGTARDLLIEGYTAEDSRRLEGYYKEPWIFGTNWNVIARGYFDEDSSTREAYGEIGISRDIGFDFSIGVFAGIGDNEKTSSLELTYTSFDRFVLPRSGTKFAGLATWNFDRPDSLDNYLKVRGKLTQYVPVYGHWISRFSGAAGGVFAPDAKLERQDLFALGGMNDFRGMDYRFLRSRAYGYTEFALLWQDGYDLSIEGFYMPGLYRASRPDHGWKEEHEYGLAFTQYRKNWSVNFYYALRNGESYLDGIVGVGVKTLF